MYREFGLIGLALIWLSGPDAVAQPKWQAFPAEQSRLVLDVPPLSRQPSRAQELTGISGQIRMFQYTWGSTTEAAAYADIMIQQPTGGVVFDRVPDYVTLIPTVWPAVKARSPVFGDSEAAVAAPLGEVRYRSLTLGPRQCVGFGGAFGPVLDGATQMAGVKLIGGNWIFGIYCPAARERLTPDGMRYVLEGIGWTDTKTATAGRTKPVAIAVTQ